MLSFRNRRAFTLIELLVVLAIIAVLIGLLIPAVQKMRSVTQRTESTNNLRQLIIAAHSFHDANGFLPFNGTVDATNADSNSGSWAYQLLPYLEQEALYNTQPNSSLVLTTPVGPFLCAMRDRPGYYTGATGTPVTGTIYFTTPGLQPVPAPITITVNPGSPYTYNMPLLPENVAPVTCNVQINNGPVSVVWYIVANNGAMDHATSDTSSTSAGLTTRTTPINGQSNWYYLITATDVTTISNSGPPGGPATDFGINPYINCATGTLNAPNSYQTLTSIPDGMSNTIFLGHMYAPVAEYPLTTASSANARLSIFCGGTDGTSRNGLGDTATTWLQDGTAIAQNQWGSPMREGGLMATADGSVHLIPYSTPLTHLLIPNDGVVVDLPW